MGIIKKSGITYAGGGGGPATLNEVLTNGNEATDKTVVFKNSIDSGTMELDSSSVTQRYDDGAGLGNFAQLAGGTLQMSETNSTETGTTYVGPKHMSLSSVDSNGDPINHFSMEWDSVADVSMSDDLRQAWKNVLNIEEPLTAGTGIDITNGVISTDDMTEAEMSALVNEVFGTSVVPDTMGYDQIYSSEETVVGKWIDGRPLYQKTIDTGAMPSTLNGTTYYKAVAHNVANMDFATSVEGFAIKTDYTVCVFPYIHARTDNSDVSGWSAYATRSEVRIQANANHSATYTKTYVTIKYVKTTD